ncbi:MAG TPA: radical SAM protein [Syntrophales bacterium]|nr:radical SAM protein [Syntrophales bacterium]HOL59838.1 radical SAM protein [Syntrophales bacterium]HPO35944.1 radical SAM protein [Syntrophales bacterium]
MVQVREIRVKGILSRSQIYDYTLNPYVGCEHACAYCYARFMKRFSGHEEPWGEFVDAKINAPERLKREIKSKRPGHVWISGVCDPYQPVEEELLLTRQCLEILVPASWPITIQTKSPLVMRDRDVISSSNKVEVGFSLATLDEDVRQIFEPHAPPISDRIQALKELHNLGIRTFVMIAPVLPKADELLESLADGVDFVLVDRLNYHYADRLYDRLGLSFARKGPFFLEAGRKIKAFCENRGIPCEILYD